MLLNVLSSWKEDPMSMLLAGSIVLISIWEKTMHNYKTVPNMNGCIFVAPKYLMKIVFSICHCQCVYNV